MDILSTSTSCWQWSSPIFFLNWEELFKWITPCTLAEIFFCRRPGWYCLSGEEGTERRETWLLSLGQWAVKLPHLLFSGDFLGSSSLSHKMLWILLGSFLVDCEWSFTYWVRGLSCPGREGRGFYLFFFGGGICGLWGRVTLHGSCVLGLWTSVCEPCTLSSRVFLITSSSVFLKQFGFTFYILPIHERKVYFL